ncbi:transport protein [Secundilactobacillus kimchicus JCM 15530]|uniref:Transport protein n=1 Tax=Secundilactobacillus kimchicus JCM 15530 TaxID=1302272 RepID=A0A0R1HZ04_9LACO|nr:MFS transporter [Secundilactobacillus kimchicus]KRK48865.1 transport protein [Secundilactobacillus kimchicus JCM 15530]
METTTSKSQARSASLTLLALALSAFAIGMTEFISVGVMPLIVTTFGIKLSTAGLTVSIYAAGVTIGAPVLTALTGRLPRKALLLAVMITFIVGNALTAVAPIFSVLLAGRVIAAFAHGLFMAVATVIAASVVAENRRASAIATMFTGLTVATVTGVPLGTFIAQHASWRVAFGFIAVLGVLALLLNVFLVPSHLPQPEAGRRGAFLRLVREPRLLAGLVITALGYGASFPIYTYMSAILTRQGWNGSQSVIVLLGYGIAVAVGNTLGGRFANHRPLHALSKMFAAMAILMTVMMLGLGNHMIGLILVLGMGLLAFMNVPGLQLFTMQVAETKLPADAQLASALNISAFNVGIVVGSFTGGQLLNTTGLMSTPAGGVVMALLALGLTMMLGRAEA